MKRPIIGITSAYEIEDGLRNYHRTTVSIDYSKSVIEAGGIPIVLPVTSNLEVIKKQLELLDGIIFAGGVDINPSYYGQDFKENMGIISPERDECEFLTLKEFYKTNKPILGICRGHQLINIFLGGTLFQDLKYKKTEVLKHSQDFYPELAVHKVKIIDNDNILSKLFGEKIATNSFHHQAVDKLGENLTPIAITEDGIIEAFQMKSHNFLYGLQWHPEMMTARGNEEMKKIFIEFVNSCK